MNMIIFSGIFLFSFYMLIMSLFFYISNLIYFFYWEMYFYMSMKFLMMIYIDYMSLMFLWVVLMIYSVVMIYSLMYMNGDLFINRFNMLVYLFVISMCFMILSPNIMSILLGWDGLGLISYCLVIYYQSSISYSSGMLTILCNRLGDIGLLMLICFSSMFGSWNLMLYNVNSFMLIFMLLAIFTKSAQMPFSSWLPAAMVAPTPVSSLVHSSTLVTAGVYLLIRYSYLFINSYLLVYILYISVFTMFMAGLIANFEFDLKKIIALSTLSQLGFMISILSMGFNELAFFHLIIHALFKSMMFLCGGGLIHLNLGSQDIRKFGNIMNLCPVKSLILIISLLSLCGFPFLSGFYSKDLIIEYFFSMKYNFIISMVFYMSMILTLSYSIRLMLFLFINKNNFFSYMNLNENLLMVITQIYMFVMVIYGGYMIMNLIYLNYFLMMSFMNKILILKIYLCGVYLGYIYYKNNMIFLKDFMFFLMSMYYVKYMYMFSYKMLLEVYFLYELYIEKSIFEILMGLFMSKFILMINYFKVNMVNLVVMMNFYLIILLFVMIMVFMNNLLYM